MKTVTVNISAVFRTKIDEGIYSFDLISVDSSTLVSSLIGYCVVKTKTDNFILGLNMSIDVSTEEIREIGRKTLEEAKNLERIFS